MRELLLNLVETMKSWSRGQSATAFAGIAGLSIWLFQRVSPIRPAILGDEYIYSANSRLTGFWEVPIQGDFSNYLFNFLYKPTVLCGESFYDCAKGLNIVFFALTLTLLLVITSSMTKSFWLPLTVILSLALSPVSVYTSLFLPESLYFFLMTVAFALLIRSAQAWTIHSWAHVGLAFGLAALAKPHAVLSLPAVAVFAFVLNLVHRGTFRGLALRAIWFLLGFLVVRFGLGLLLGGPAALGLAGQYLGETAVANLTQSEGQVSGNNIPQAITELFLPMLTYHWASTVALFGVSLAAMIMHIALRARSGKPSISSSVSLLVLIWLISLLVVVALFTGYVTGTGDDHSSRMLLRYYEFLFLLIPVAGFISVSELSKDRVSPIWLRALVVAVLAPGIFYAFGGLFDSLTIQIADAPTLAGLIPNFEVFSVISAIGILSLGLVLFWPDSLKIAVVAVTVSFSVLTGFETLNQYQVARGSDSQADMAGYSTSAYLSREGFGADTTVVVIAQTRFEATNAAFWIDRGSTYWDYYAPGIVDRDLQVFSAADFVLGLGGVILNDGALEVASGEGFVLYKLVESED